MTAISVYTSAAGHLTWQTWILPSSSASLKETAPCQKYSDYACWRLSFKNAGSPEDFTNAPLTFSGWVITGQQPWHRYPPAWYHATIAWMATTTNFFCCPKKCSSLMAAVRCAEPGAYHSLTRQTMRRQACGITTLPSRQSRYSMWSAAVARRFMPCPECYSRWADEKQKSLIRFLPNQAECIWKAIRSWLIHCSSRGGRLPEAGWGMDASGGD